jgi:hypothetical protein
LTYPTSSTCVGATSKRALAPLALACIGAMSVGCATAGSGLHLGERKAAETGSIGAWDVLACSTLEGIPVIPPGGLRYVLVRGEDGLALREEASGTASALVTERWVEADGTHFYASSGEEGWELVIRSTSERGIRRVYRRTIDGTRPSGPITAVCPMVVSTL